MRARAIDDLEAGAGAHRRAQRAQDRFRVRDLVIGVGDKHRVDRPRRQVRIVDVVVNDTNVPLPTGHGANPQKRQRLPAQIDGQHTAITADHWRQLQREVSSAGTEVDHHVAWMHVEALNNLRGPLPSVPLGFDLCQRPQRQHRLLDDVDERQHDDDDDEQAGDPHLLTLHLSAGGVASAVRITTLTIAA